MNKKIICIGIIGMFLLMSLSLSTAAIETNTSKEQSNIETKTTSGDKPDLIVSIHDVRAFFIPEPPFFIPKFKSYIGTVTVTNIGTAIITIDDGPLNVWLTAEYEGKEVSKGTIDWWRPNRHQLNPGWSLSYSIIWDTLKGVRYRSTLKAFVDPTNIHEELNEDNNKAEIIGPISKTRNLRLTNILQETPAIYQLLQRLLKL